jgi:hypothetical protein
MGAVTEPPPIGGARYRAARRFPLRGKGLSQPSLNPL